MKDKYPLLFSPGKLGSLTIRNRIVFLPHYPAFDTDDGTIKDTYINYYAERARGGAGLLITESYAVQYMGKTGKNNLEAWDKKALPGYKRMSAEAHKYGARMFVQLSHGGHYTVAQPPQLLIAPTQMSDPGYHYNTKEMEIEDIKSVVQSFAASAKYVREGGFDGVEIKGAAHDGILRSFISPYFNRRKDEYGGSFENRMRFPLEVVHAIRKAVGPDFVFGVRVSMDEFTSWGYGIEEGKLIAEAFADTGEVDYIDTDAGCFSSLYMQIPPMCMPPGYAEYLSVAIKEIINLPVIAFGRINDPVQAEKILADGSADFIGMARQLVCDPEFGNKAQEGREEEIRHCIACQDGCIYQVMQDKPIRCIQNPAVGREVEFGIGSLRTAKLKKEIIVVGGGPAGLKLAEIAAKRGHRVTIYEKNKEFGGQVKIAAKIPFREEVNEVIRHLVVEIESLGVDIHLNEEVSAEKIIEMEKDVVIIATGSFPSGSDITGSEQSHVVSVWDVLLEKEQIGNHVVIYDITRRWPGLGTAEFLANQGKMVEIVSPSIYVGQQIEPSNINLAYQRLLEKDVTLIPSSILLEIKKREVVIANVYSQKQHVIEDVDTVVMSVGNSSNRDLYDTLKGKIKELHCIGDALAPRLIQQVIFESEMLGREI
jgi:mycofactocin system FadH/OYE family oxidoreductase 2